MPRTYPLASFVSCVALLGACSSSTSTPAAVVDADASVVDAAPSDDAASSDAQDAALPPGPSFTIEASELAIDNPGAPGRQSTSYKATLDPAVPEGGKPSMRLESLDGATAKTFAATTATRPIDDGVTRRRYRMHAKIKTEQTQSGGWLWFRIDGPALFFLLDNMQTPVDRRIKDTADWQEVSLVLDVPKGASNFAFGSGIVGLGKVWVSTIHFEQVGADVPVTPSFGLGD